MAQKSTSADIELLAPAGSIDSFHAAIDAGADAVYLGLTDFNARLRAKNFTAKTIAYLLPYARKNGVKLYVTLNTLIKQAELEPAVHTLFQLDQIGVDGLIVADAGLISLAARHFPRLRLHASTQMDVHNAAGALAAAKLGMRRVILARELTVEEIRSIGAAAGIELEVFVHGALCYSVSGLCLASSFLGGASGNRGRCTQVCRRPFAVATGSGHYFSCRDLCAADFLPQLRDAGVASLKIEGRMKNAAYVHAVVGAWRKLLDNEISPARAQELLLADLGRKKSALFLSGVRQRAIIDAAAPPGTGQPLGAVIETHNEQIIIPPATTLAPGDRVRVQPKNGFEGAASDVRSVSHENGRTVLLLKQAVACGPGDTLLLVGRAEGCAWSGQTGVTGVEPVAFNPHFPGARGILGGRMAQHAPAEPSRRELLWVKTDAIGWLDLLQNTPCQRLIFAGGAGGQQSLLADEARIKVWRSRLVVGLPPFIPQAECDFWQKLIARAKQAGISKGCCAAPGQELLFGKGFELVADSPMVSFNRAAHDALKERGFASFVYSREDDYLNIQASAPPHGIACLFAHVPLFISRVRPAVKPLISLCDRNENRFFVAQADGLFYLLSQEPLCLTHRRAKLAALGVRDFLLDLSFVPPSPGLLQQIIQCYKTGTRLPGSSMFNFKAGLK